MRAVLKTFCGCCYPKYSSVAKDGEEEGGAPCPTRVGQSDGSDESEFDLENPPLAPPAARGPIYRCEVVLPETVLQEGSSVHGFHLAPWEKHEEYWEQLNQESPAQGSPVSLSRMQKAAMSEWCCMAEWLRRQGHRDLEPKIFDGIPDSSKIRQGRVTDCSLMSVLSVLADYERTFGDPVLRNILHPALAPNSAPPAVQHYACRLFVNGMPRCVVVDDTVPVATNGRLLCAHSAIPHELWVLLIEKAVATIMGGSYAMRGSNPCTDAFHITGWIPETFPLKPDCEGAPSTESEFMEMFDTAQQGFGNGKCVVCVGTTDIADATTNELAVRSGHVEGVSVSTGLVAGHAYPVLRCCTVQGRRLLFLKNPWGHTRWKGKFSPGDVQWQANPGLAEALNYDNTAAVARDDGSFWISWEEVLRFFSHFYIAWSPSALTLHSTTLHGCWNPWPHFVHSTLTDDTDLLAFNPQFRVRLKRAPPVNEEVGLWAVLSRHIRSQADYNSHFVSVSIYQGGSRVCCPNSVLEQGVFSNGECALVKLRNDAANSNSDFTLVVSQHGAKREFNYTLQVYTQREVIIEELPPLVPKSYASSSVRGEWTRRTAGGCSNSVWSYFQNPQWAFDVPPGGLDDLILFLESPGVSVNVRVFTGAVARPEVVRSAASSGAYRRGCCFLRLRELPPGPHVAVVSSFRSGICAPYRLAWHSSSAVGLTPQPHPFVDGALAHPMKSLVQQIQVGRSTEIQIRLVDFSKASGLGHMSARLQTNSDEGEVPLLELLSAHPQRPAPYCVKLRPTEADQYYQLSGAAVIVFAQLVPGESYVLETKVPRNRATRDAKLYINSDKAIVIDNLTSPRNRRR
ncbi:CAPN7 [Symbiodinium sp. CCMP2592]|nr:CAPN7 [Symbiodinium sp. CCMP2592]